MELESLLPKPTYGGSGTKWWYLRRRYHSLNGGGKKMKIIRLRSTTRKYWRIRPIPRLRWVMMSPLKMLTKLKNVYMNFMLRVACNVGTMNTGNIFGLKRIPKAPQVSKGYSVDEFDARLIYEISKALVASHELYPM